MINLAMVVWEQVLRVVVILSLCSAQDLLGPIIQGNSWAVSHSTGVNSLATGWWENNFESVIFKLIPKLISWANPMKLLLGEYHNT